MHILPFIGYSLLFLFYSFLCGYGILKIPFIRKSGIQPRVLLLFFALHVLTGCLHNIIAWRFYPQHGDIWNDFQLSFMERDRLTSNFSQFLSDNSAWTLFSHNAIIFVQIILNLFSFDNLYINTLLFSFPIFLGNVALYRLFRRRFPADPLTAVTIFLLPSTLFWTSCIHRDAALYALLGAMLYRIDRRGKTTFYAGIFFLLIIYFRSAVAFTLVPALLGWWLLEAPPFSSHSHRSADRHHPTPDGHHPSVAHHPSLAHRLILASACIGVVIIPALASPTLPGRLLQAFSAHQRLFQILEGHSRLYLPVLDGTWRGLLHVLPAAIRNGLFEPLPGSGGQPIYLAFSVELMLIWAVVVVASISAIRSRPSKVSSPFPPLAFPVFCVIFALTGMLLIGTLVPFAGAIIRYRSIYLPFLLAPFLHSIHRFSPVQQLNARLARILPEPESGLSQTLTRPKSNL
jgi:hypothetical protein